MVSLLSIPQGLAYAAIAGLPPVVGLYAAAIPAAVGALLRSTRHVIVGPSNAVSLLVGAGVVATTIDPTAAALTLALVAGVVQIGLGLLGLGLLVDYVSGPVVRGYITGAALLIALGQLAHWLGTPVRGGAPLPRPAATLGDLGQSSAPVLLTTGATMATILLVRQIARRSARKLPDALAGLAVGALVAGAFGSAGRFKPEEV